MIAKRFIIAASCVLLLCGIAEGRADSPMPPPEKIEHPSPSGKFVAVSDPAESRVRVFARSEQNRALRFLWEFPEYLRHFYLIENGPTIVVEWVGMNLLPRDVADEFVVLRFIREGKVIRKYAVKDLVSRRDLKRTVSHLNWRREYLVDDAGRLFINTESGERWFDIASGELIPRPRESSLFKH